ncbi:hypothetical protein KAR91_80895 [Candidatus Pacearchaeota archaeon]|nr:hypothetical protein [Candidatus Pacearchaeota archaeon]
MTLTKKEIATIYMALKYHKNTDRRDADFKRIEKIQGKLEAEMNDRNDSLFELRKDCFGSMESQIKHKYGWNGVLKTVNQH